MVYYLIRLASWLAGKVPRRVRLAVAGPVTELIYFGWVSKRHATIANMAQVLGTSPRDPRARRLARLSWRNFGRYISDFLYLPNTTQEDIVARTQDTSPAPGSFALVDEALAPGKGAIVASAHLGAYDVAAIVVASHSPVHVIVESLRDPRMDRMWQEQRRKFGLELLYMERTPRPILRALQQNGVVAVAVDRPLPPGEGVPVTFFGRQCWVPGGIAQIALKSGAAVLPGFCIYDERYSSTYYLGGGPVIFPQPVGARRASPADRQADTVALMQRIFDALEAQIRKRPDQWAMFRRFWPEHDTAPETASIPAEKVVAGGS